MGAILQIAADSHNLLALQQTCNDSREEGLRKSRPTKAVIPRIPQKNWAQQPFGHSLGAEFHRQRWILPERMPQFYTKGMLP